MSIGYRIELLKWFRNGNIFCFGFSFSKLSIVEHWTAIVTVRFAELIDNNQLELESIQRIFFFFTKISISFCTIENETKCAQISSLGTNETERNIPYHKR